MQIGSIIFNLDRAIKTLVFFHKHHTGLAVPIWFVSLMLSAIWGQGDAIITLVYTVIFGAIGTGLMAAYIGRLNERINAEFGGPVWMVMLNGVGVGEIRDSEYARIYRDILTDHRFYLAQAMNFLNALSNVVGMQFRTIPIVFFWFGAFAYFHSPAEFAEAMSSLSGASSSEIASLLALPLLVVSIGVGIGMVVNNKYGLTNIFEKECNGRLRQAMKTAALGDFTLTKINVVENGKS